MSYMGVDPASLTHAEMYNAPSTFRAVWVRERKAYAVENITLRVWPSTVPAGSKHADPDGARRAPELAEALNRVYGVAPKPRPAFTSHYDEIQAALAERERTR